MRTNHVVRNDPSNSQPVGYVKCKLCEAFPILIEGDIELIDSILAQINIYNQAEVKVPVTKKRVLIIPNISVIGHSEEPVNVDIVKLNFTDTIFRSSERIINGIMANNMPLIRLYIQDTGSKTKNRGEELVKIKDFVVSNYQKEKFEAIEKSKGMLSGDDSIKAIKTWWGIISVARVTKAQVRSQSIISSKHPCDPILREIANIIDRCKDNVFSFYLCEDLALGSLIERGEDSQIRKTVYDFMKGFSELLKIALSYRLLALEKDIIIQE